MTATFDPQQYLAGLEAAGAPKKQAPIHAHTLSVALKGVVRNLDLDRAVACLGREMGQMEERLNVRIDCLRIELKAEIAELRARMAAIQIELNIHGWALGGWFGLMTANLVLTFLGLTFRLACPSIPVTAARRAGKLSTFLH